MKDVRFAFAHFVVCPQRLSGALTAIYRYFGKHMKAGIGYNFTEFSDDLTDLGYNHQGVFFNLVGSM